MKPAHATRSRRFVRVASIGFGGYIALSSAVLMFVGVRGWGGWLAITYGSLGIATGLAGAAATFVDRPFRSALFGWFFVGVALRSIIDGTIYLMLFTAPFALLMLVALLVELSSHPSLANVAAGLTAGAAAIIAIFALRAVAPYFPAICPPTPAGVMFMYPGSGGFFDEAQSKFDDICLPRGFT